MHMHVLQAVRPGERVPGPENIELPSGYRVVALARDLNYPSAVSWDPDGNLLIAEGGFPYGRADEAAPRILRRGADGGLEVVAEGLDQLVGDIAVYRGLLYVSHRGRISVVEEGHIRDLIAGLPSWGLCPNGPLAFDRAGRLYFGQGTVSNAGVVGPAELEQLYRTGHPDGHDIPGANVVLTGQNYASANPITGEVRPTGAFSPWGRATAPGERIAGAWPDQAASGAIMSARWDGSDLRVHAWGLRNPAGLAFGPDLRLYAANQGARPLEPRPIAKDSDTFWQVEEGAWYGWPDYYGGQPVTATGFQQPQGLRLEFLLAHHVELLPGRPRPPHPVASLGLQVGASGMDFNLQPRFGFVGQAFVAEFGPLLGPREMGAGYCPDQGRRVVRVDPASGQVSDFCLNRSRAPASEGGNRGGLERPLQARFGPDGNLYIVDFGVVEFREDVDDWVATPRTGIVWQVSRP